MPLNIVQAFADHANISTSSRYLKLTRVGMQAAMKRYEDAREGTKRAQTPQNGLESVGGSVSERTSKPRSSRQLRPTMGA
jgi:hypothetical protein